MIYTGCLKKKGDLFIGPQMHRFTHPVFSPLCTVPNLPMHTEENTGCVKPSICGPINTSPFFLRHPVYTRPQGPWGPGIYLVPENKIIILDFAFPKMICGILSLASVGAPPHQY